MGFTHDSIVGQHFSLSFEDRPPIVFNEISLRKAVYTKSSEKLVYEMPGFDPTDYQQLPFTDLIAATKKEGSFNGMYFSDVVFKSKSGNDITFFTLDGKNSQQMSIKTSPTGLLEGQKVRIYYSASIQMWSIQGGDFLSGQTALGVYAIEKL